MDIPKKYEPSEVEGRLYAEWLESGLFRARADESRKPYTVVMPPPNVTGILHMGHVLNNTVQDVLVRRKRMLGYNACWVPGTDHASIATEAKVVSMLKSSGIDKSSLTREEFMEHAFEWKEKYGGIIVDQLKKLGVSADWSRSTFTMDPAYYEAVIRVFVDLHRKGLIYKGSRMVNWDPVGMTVISDEEVVHEERSSVMYKIRYQIEGEPGKFLTVATTRPETVYGDTAIAVSPEDARYSHLVGMRAVVPLCGRSVPIIADDSIDPSFGTGCMKVTPSHDFTDAEIGSRHSLPSVLVLNDDGTLNSNCGSHSGMDRFAARERVAAELSQIGICEQEAFVCNVATSERTGAVLEPMVSTQWFLRTGEMSALAEKAVLGPDADVKLIPERYLGTYRHWLENTRDWCISRQLWWGHRIPAYYLPTGETFVAATREEAMEAARMSGYAGPEEDLTQDEDVLDTWFSSWLWPMAVFDAGVCGNADARANADFGHFYPTDDLVTAPDILFFWVARMIMASHTYTGKSPFSNVYLTGTVRDKDGKKMSKQLGNSPDPLELIDTYGADGVRVGMLLFSPPGNDLIFKTEYCEQGRNFANKLWNSFRLLCSMRESRVEKETTELELTSVRWMRSKMSVATAEYVDAFNSYRLSDALMVAYRLTWDDFCGWFLELVKPAKDNSVSAACLEQTLRIFEELLKLLHPFMPFVTEELWRLSRDRGRGDYLALATPGDPGEPDISILEEMELARELVGALRNYRVRRGLPQNSDMRVSATKEDALALGSCASALTKLGRVSAIEELRERPAGMFSVLVKSREFFVPEHETQATEKEILALERELARISAFAEKTASRLANDAFVANAGTDVVERERMKLSDALAKADALALALEQLNSK